MARHIIEPLLNGGTKALKENGPSVKSLARASANAEVTKVKANRSTFVPEDTVADLSYKPSDNFVKAERQKRIDTSPVYTWNNIKDTKITSLDDITEWNSEFKSGTKEHFKDFGLAMKLSLIHI